MASLQKLCNKLVCNDFPNAEPVKKFYAAIPRTYADGQNLQRLLCTTSK